MERSLMTWKLLQTSKLASGQFLGIIHFLCREFDVLEYKVNKMEHSVGSILSKIEIVLEQLSLVEVAP